MIKLSIRERREQFLIFSGIFLLTTAVLGFCIFHDFGSERKISKDELSAKIAEDLAFEETVREQRATVDTTYKQIILFDPGVRAVFLEKDIKDYLSSIKSVYDRKAYDERYKTFVQISQLYQAFFYNRRELKGNNLDVENISKSLDDCKLSTSQLRQTMGSQSR